MLNTPQFNDFFYDGIYKRDLDNRNKGLAVEYSSLVRNVRDTSGGAETPSSLKSALSNFIQKQNLNRSLLQII